MHACMHARIACVCDKGYYSFALARYHQGWGTDSLVQITTVAYPSDSDLPWDLFCFSHPCSCLRTGPDLVCLFLTHTAPCFASTRWKGCGAGTGSINQSTSTQRPPTRMCDRSCNPTTLKSPKIMLCNSRRSNRFDRLRKRNICRSHFCHLQLIVAGRSADGTRRNLLVPTQA
jgi:hypothetical protein